MAGAVWLQGSYNPVCDFTNNEEVQGKFIIVTGGALGIGYETSLELFKRGARVLIASRNEANLVKACASIKAAIPQSNGSIDYFLLDLGDLDSVVSFTKRVLTLGGAAGPIVDMIVENAGVWPRQHSLSKQGHEMAFAVNVLGHHLLRRRLIKMELLKPEARIVTVTGDIYVLASEASPDFVYEGEGQMAYCRSKLAVNWVFNEFHRRNPSFFTCLVHPGVVATELAGDNVGVTAAIKAAILLDTQQGAQTSLICATAPKELLVNGAYYHNTCGLMTLSADDAASDLVKSTAMWDVAELLTEPFM